MVYLKARAYSAFQGSRIGLVKDSLFFTPNSRPSFSSQPLSPVNEGAIAADYAIRRNGK